MNPNRPWWADHLPDLRGIATAAMFGLVYNVFWLVAHHPELKDNELFKEIATLLVGTGGFGLACAYMWGGSKASVAAADTVNKMAAASASPQVTAPAATTQTVNLTPPAEPDASK